jgi:hypothetical protein
MLHHSWLQTLHYKVQSHYLCLSQMKRGFRDGSLLCPNLEHWIKFGSKFIQFNQRYEVRWVSKRNDDDQWNSLKYISQLKHEGGGYDEQERDGKFSHWWKKIRQQNNVTGWPISKYRPHNEKLSGSNPWRHTSWSCPWSLPDFTNTRRGMSLKHIPLQLCSHNRPSDLVEYSLLRYNTRKPLKVSRCWVGTCRLHLHDWRIS